MLFYKSWIVFVYALALSIESIIIEYLTIYYVRISPIVLSSLSISLSGIMLLSVGSIIFKNFEDLRRVFTKSWRSLIIASLALSLGIYAWYDSINRIGASKEALVAAPTEIILIIILARVFLNERLNKFQFIGIIIGSVGFFLSLASDVPIDYFNNTYISVFMVGININSVLPTVSFLFSLGDLEAILSAVGFAVGVLFLGKLVKKHSSVQVAGASMFLSGMILVVFMVISLLYESTSTTVQQFNESPSQLELLSINRNLVLLLLFSLIPFVGSLSYVIGLRRIGASLTATIGSSNIVIILVIQILLKELGYPSHLPENLFLAIFGCITGFLGIFVIHMSEFIIAKSKRLY